MFTNDPFQTQLTSLTSGAYAGAMNPFGLPYTQLQTAINPTLLNPQQGYAGIPNYGAIAQPQQLQQQQQQQLQQIQQQVQQLQQLASILASQGVVPQQFGQTIPWQSQLQPNVFQNPLLGQNPLVNPILAQQLALQAGSIYGQPQFGQAGSPWGQQNVSPFAQSAFTPAGYSLAPQSWVGQQVPGQIHPHHLSQLAARGLY
jgi:hypothetical protein